jgi:hypothetical protein
MFHSQIYLFGYELLSMITRLVLHYQSGIDLKRSIEGYQMSTQKDSLVICR